MHFHAAPLHTKYIAHHGSGDQTAQGISDSTGTELVVLNETQQQPHIAATAAECSQLFLNGLVQLRHAKKKQHWDKSACKAGKAPLLFKSGL